MTLRTVVDIGIVVLLCLNFDASCSKGMVSDKAPLCSAMEHPSDFVNREVTFDGTVKGFHYLLLSNDACPEARFSLFLSPSPDVRETLVHKLEMVGNTSLERGNFNFASRVTGRFEYINRLDQSQDCFVPEGIIASDIEYCLSVQSLEGVEIVK